MEVVHRIISGTLAKTVREGLVTSNAAARLELERPRRRPTRVLRPEEVEAIADAIEPRYRVLVLTAAYGALRFGEAAGLRKRDLRLLERKLQIDGSVIQVGSKVERVESTKTEGSLRQVAVPPFLADELARHLAGFPVATDNDLLFTAPAGGPLSRTVFRNRVWVPACLRAGLAEADRSPGGRFKGWKEPPPRFHDLRHTGVAMAIKANAHPRTIQAWVGHSSIKTTMDVYGHLYDEAHEELAAGLEALRTAALANLKNDVVSLPSGAG